MGEVYNLADYRKKNPPKLRTKVSNAEVIKLPIVRLKEIMGDRTIKIENDDGEIEEMGPKELHQYLMKLTNGGEYTTIIEKHLKEHGVIGDQWENRKMVLNIIINDIKHYGQESEDNKKAA
jgi:hypothetical protein